MKRLYTKLGGFWISMRYDPEDAFTVKHSQYFPCILSARARFCLFNRSISQTFVMKSLWLSCLSWLPRISCSAECIDVFTTLCSSCPSNVHSHTPFTAMEMPLSFHLLVVLISVPAAPTHSISHGTSAQLQSKSTRSSPLHLYLNSRDTDKATPS